MRASSIAPAEVKASTSVRPPSRKRRSAPAQLGKRGAQVGDDEDLGARLTQSIAVGGVGEATTSTGDYRRAEKL